MRRQRPAPRGISAQPDAGAEVRPKPCTHHADLLRKVAGLCNNANQLAHVANATGYADQTSVEEMTRIARQVWEEVKENW